MEYIIYFSILLGVFALALTPAICLSLVAYVISLYMKRFDIADVFWGISIVVSVLTLFFLITYPTVVLKIVTILVLVWGIRLSLHVGSRFFASRTEDARYAEWRSNWKFPALRAFFQIFLFQAVLMAVILSPIVMYVFNPGPIAIWQVALGLWMWTVGFVFQLVADWQLTQFKLSPERYGLSHQDIMTKGIWSLSRHPNYFGELLMWWGIFVIIAHSWHLLYIIPAAIGPIVLTFLLLFVSGVAKTEKNWRLKYPNSYIRYKESVPIFFPRFWSK